MDKKQLRIELKGVLLAAGDDKREQKSKKACENLISTKQFQNASTIMMYLSLPHEVDTSQAILFAWQLGKIVVVPKISWHKKDMIPVRIDTLDVSFSKSVSGLRNPVDGQPMLFDKIDFVVAPGLGFDRKGNRLGRGGGYYDKFLANEKLNADVCGFGFSEQLIDSVPVTDTDMAMDFLVTDEQVIYFNHEKKGV